MGEEASPYVVALIAVGGTVVGALIASITQVLTSRASARRQREALEQQYDMEHRQYLRQDKRLVFARFLRHMDEWNILFNERYHLEQSLRQADDGERQATLDDDAIMEIERRKDETFKEWRQAFSELTLISNENLTRMAALLVNGYLDAWHRACHGENPIDAVEQVKPAMLRAVMQEELGIKDRAERDSSSELGTVDS